MRNQEDCEKDERREIIIIIIIIYPIMYNMLFSISV